MGEEVKQTDLVHIHPFEGGLEQFEVVKVFVLQLGLKLDLFKTDAAGEKKIHELAIGSSYRGPKANMREVHPPTTKEINQQLHEGFIRPNGFKGLSN